jgi:hypothetical protein
MAYMGHPSTFQPMIDALREIKQHEDPTEAAALGERIVEMLSARVKEEPEGTGDLRADFARVRISPDVEILKGFYDGALENDACPELLNVIETVLSAAREALGRAPIRVVKTDVVPSYTPPWAKAASAQAVDQPKLDDD